MLAIFRSHLVDENATEFRKLADRMLVLARSMPGFVSYKVYIADDGERCSIIEFDSREHLEAWRDHPEHRHAQQTGRDRYYEQYSLHVCDPERESTFSR